MAQRRLNTASLEEVVTEISQARPVVTPTKGGFYSAEGDCVFLHLEDVPHYGERVDELLTVYCALDDDRLVGLEIKGISKLPYHDALAIKLGTRKRRPASKIEAIELLLLTYRYQTEQHHGIGDREFDRYRQAFGAVGRGTPVELQSTGA